MAAGALQKPAAPKIASTRSQPSFVVHHRMFPPVKFLERGGFSNRPYSSSSTHAAALGSTAFIGSVHKREYILGPAKRPAIGNTRRVLEACIPAPPDTFPVPGHRAVLLSRRLSAAAIALGIRSQQFTRPARGSSSAFP